MNSANDYCLVHECFDQQSGETKPPKCGCGTRISFKEMDGLIKRGDADFLVKIRNGKSEQVRRSIVLRRRYINERDAHPIDATKMIGLILRAGYEVSLANHTVRLRDGSTFPVAWNSTDYGYWRQLLEHLGEGENIPHFLEDARAVSVSASGLTDAPSGFRPTRMSDEIESTLMARDGRVLGIDSQIEATRLGNLKRAKRDVKSMKAKVTARANPANASWSFGKYGRRLKLRGKAGAGTPPIFTDDGSRDDT